MAFARFYKFAIWHAGAPSLTKQYSSDNGAPNLFGSRDQGPQRKVNVTIYIRTQIHSGTATT